MSFSFFSRRFARLASLSLTSSCNMIANCMPNYIVSLETLEKHDFAPVIMRSLTSQLLLWYNVYYEKNCGIDKSCDDDAYIERTELLEPKKKTYKCTRFTLAHYI